MVILIRVQHIKDTARRPGLGIRRAKDNPRNTGMDDRPGAHGAGFKGDIESGVDKTVVTQRMSSGTERLDLGMGRGVVLSDGAIPPLGDELAVFNQHRPHRHLTLTPRLFGEAQGVTHPVVIGRFEGGGLSHGGRLFPLDSAGRLASDVVNHAGDARHFVNDAARNVIEELIGQMGPTRSHEVDGLNRT